MNGLDKIIARMESDIRAECDALAANAAENAAAIRRDYQAQADAAARDSAQRAQTQAAEHLEHLNGSSQLACRQRVLAAKQQLIDEAFARTAQALAALPQADYIDLLAALAAENGSGDEELLLSARDREAVGAAGGGAGTASKPRRPGSPADARQKILHLLALESERGFVGHVLADAAAAAFIDWAERLGAVRAFFQQFFHAAKSVALFRLDDAHQRAFAGKKAGNEYGDALMAADALSILTEGFAGHFKALVSGKHGMLLFESWEVA